MRLKLKVCLQISSKIFVCKYYFNKTPHTLLFTYALQIDINCKNIYIYINLFFCVFFKLTFSDEISVSDPEAKESENESDDSEAEVSEQECGNIVSAEATTDCTVPEQPRVTGDGKLFQPLSCHWFPLPFLVLILCCF